MGLSKDFSTTNIKKCHIFSWVLSYHGKYKKEI